MNDTETDEYPTFAPESIDARLDWIGRNLDEINRKLDRLTPLLDAIENHPMLKAMMR